ncbi:MAG TPA: PIG-L family deacetylase [Verrucomicrobiae bacterium]|jgi:LmbE family N-acetylglucosaminyl deacetylase
MNTTLGQELLEKLCPECGEAEVSTPILVVVAHPDDEFIGAGARFSHWSALSFVHVTDGAPRDMRDARESGFVSREAYAEARRNEFHKALGLVGAKPQAEHMLGFVDQESSNDLPRLTQRLLEIIRELKPEAIVTHPYEGGHPDHDATAFAVGAAVRLMEQQHENVPSIIEMTSYHNGPYGMVAGEFLPVANCEPIVRVLSTPECALKRRLYSCFASQQRTLRWFPIESESFRFAPQYDFTRPPHDGKLFYEQFKWGTDGARWRQLAARASKTLRIA